MTFKNKMHWVLRVSAGAAIVALTAGCATDQNDGVVHGEQFVSNDASRSVNEFTGMEAANAARADSTVRDYHFDGVLLNSLGEERLDLMLRNGQTPSPLTVYIDLSADDANTPKRRAAVTAYLKDRGLTDDQIVLKSEPNPDVNSPVAPLLAANGGTAAATAAPAAPSATAAH